MTADWCQCACWLAPMCPLIGGHHFHWLALLWPLTTNLVCRASRLMSCDVRDPVTWSERKRKFWTDKLCNCVRETNGSLDSSNSCKWLSSSRLHKLHESKFTSVVRIQQGIQFIRSKLAIFLLMVRCQGGSGHFQCRREDGETAAVSRRAGGSLEDIY